MAYEDRPNTAKAFKNRRKERESHADLTGDANITVECPHCGKESNHSFWLNVWKKLDRNKDDWISCSFNKKNPRPPFEKESDEKKNDRRTTSENIDDDIPFN